MSIDVKILGRLARDPEAKAFNDNSFAVFTFATNSAAKDKDGKPKSIFVEVSAWGKNADLIMQYCKKGSYLNITGVVYDTSAFLGKDGNPRSKLSITLEKFEFVSGTAKSKQQSYLNADPVDDSDIPF